jgi:predicted DNA-binding transcriptional regulator AlpA
MRSLAPPPDRFIKLEEVKHIVGLGKTFLYFLINKREFPQPVKIRGASRWSEQQIYTWVADQKSGMVH